MVRKMKVLKVALSLIIVAILLTPTVSALAPRPVAQEIPYGPYLDEIVFFEESSEEKMLKMIEKGEAQIWLWPLRTLEGKRYAEESPDIELISAYSGCFDFFLNPVDTLPETGEFNVFSIREVREALNMYIDREFIAREIMGGYGIPHYTVFPPVRPDYTRLYAEMKEIEAEYAYNPDEAIDIISEALTRAGCRYVAGKWYYNDKPITIRIVIRVEDVRKDIGDYIAGELEKLGFTVERIYAPATKAIPLVYGGDPRLGEWHIYTEGWAFTAIAAYDDDLPYYMYCSPWTGAVFEYYMPAPPLPDLAKKLLDAAYTSAEERNDWVLRLTRLCLRDSTRVWCVWEVSPFPRAKDFVNVAYDLTGGAYSLYTLRTARYADKIGGSAKVGNRLMFTSAWNRIGGFKWLYDTLPGRAIYDFGVYTHPHTGRYIPIRANFTVQTAGPDGKLPVPEDAIIFNPATFSFKTVGPGVEATSAVTFKFNFGKWHHGQPITMADVMYSMAEIYRIAYENDTLYDPASVTPGRELFIDKCRGVTIDGPDQVTVYIDYWHIDPTFIAATADIWPLHPWEVMALMNKAVENRELAFSDTRATEWGVEWLDLSKGPSMDILKKHLDELKAENYIPDYIKDWVTSDEAAARWEALSSWYDTYGHFLVCDGPFYLYSVDPAAKMAVLKAFREYVFRADHWDYLVVPKVPEISISPIPDIVPGMPVNITVTSTLAGEPYSEVSITVLVIDAKGRTVIEKAAELVEPGKFVATLSEADTAGLTPGVYTVTAIGVGAEAALAKIASSPATVVPLVGYFEERFEDLETSVIDLKEGLTELGASVEERLGALGESIGEAITGIGDTVKALGDTLTEALTKLGQELGSSMKGVEDRLTSKVDTTREELTSSIEELSDSVAALSATVSTIMYLVAFAVILSIISIVVSVWAVRRS